MTVTITFIQNCYYFGTIKNECKKWKYIVVFISSRSRVVKASIYLVIFRFRGFESRHRHIFFTFNKHNKLFWKVWYHKKDCGVVEFSTTEVCYFSQNRMLKNENSWIQTFPISANPIPPPPPPFPQFLPFCISATPARTQFCIFSTFIPPPHTHTHIHTHFYLFPFNCSKPLLGWRITKKRKNENTRITTWRCTD